MKNRKEEERKLERVECFAIPCLEGICVLKRRKVQTFNQNNA